LSRFIPIVSFFNRRLFCADVSSEPDGTMEHGRRIICFPLVGTSHFHFMIHCADQSARAGAKSTSPCLQLQKSGIQVAFYWTEALPRKELERMLHEAVRLARARLEAARG
jgi:hypothetical protein